MFNKKRAYLNRFKKIINTFAKYGFGHLIRSMGIEELSRHLPFPFSKDEKNIPELSKAERFRLVLEELGPTFIKFGQLLSTRPDLMPRDYIMELRLLQDHVQPFPFSRVRETLEKELKHSLDILFDSFDEEPLAAASISQVHAAILPGGKKVAVKVQRPEIEQIIEQDLLILKEIGALLDKYTALGKLYNFSELVEEFAHITRLELNFYHEGKNAERLRNAFRHGENILIPQIYWNYTTVKVLTMDFMEGTTLSQKDKILEKGYSTYKIVEELTRAYLRQIMVNGFYHGDPHPGNIGITSEGKLYFLDFGIVGQLSVEQQQYIATLLQAILEQNTDQILNAMGKLGAVPPQADKDELKYELERLQEMYFDLPLKELNLGRVMYELLEISFKLRIKMPREFTVLAKTLLTLEGVVSELEPGFSIAELIEQNRSLFLRYQFSGKRIKAELYKNVRQYLHLLEILPENLASILEKASGGEIHFKIKLSEIEFLLSRLNSMANRLSFSVVLASIILGLCLLLQFTEVSLFRQYALAEIALILAAIMGFWWLWAILRSGRL